MRRVTDPEFIPPTQNPFPVGTSPFRQKGTGYLGDFDYFTSCVPGGAGAVLKAIPDDATRAFLSQKFLASEWYDAFPNLYMQLVAARLRGLTLEEHRRRTGAWHVEALNGIYRALLRMVSNESVARWGPRISALYWDFGKIETQVVGPKEVAFVRHGTPKPLLRWLVWASVGFADASLRLAGARNAVTTVHEVETDGTRVGQELCSVRFRVAWS